MSFMNEHVENCTPVAPCNNCKAVSLLKADLKPARLKTFLELLGEDAPPPSGEPPAPETLLEDIPEIMELGTRVTLCLLNENIKTFQQLQELMEKSDVEILRIPNFGRKSLVELKAAMNKFRD